MIILRIVILSFICTFCISYIGYGQKFETHYIIDSIPNIANFNILNKEENTINRSNEILKQKDKYGYDKILFKSNRSRVYLKKYWDDVEDSLANDVKIDFMPLYCTCDFKNDTISIETGWSYYGTLIFNIELLKNVFNSKIILNEKIIEMQFQKLILENEPKFKNEDKLTGLLIFKTKKQEIKNEFKNETNQRHYEGKIYFTCITDKYKTDKTTNR